MVWYVPPLSPIQNAIEKGVIDHRGPIPNVEDLRNFFNSICIIQNNP
jgi:nitrate reductase beta subunit